MTCSTGEESNDSFSKDPNSSLDYDCDWAPAAGPWLKDGDTIESVAWEVGDGITHDPGRSGFTDTKTTVWVLPGGTVGQTYEVVTRITTVQGRIEDQTQHFYIEEH